MKKRLIIVIAIFTLIVVCACDSDLLVKVNDEKISKNYYFKTEELLRKSGLIDENKENKIDENILSFIIDNEVLYQRAKNKGYNATKEEIDDRYNNTINKLRSIAVEKDEINEDNLDKEFIQSVCKKDITVEKYKEDYIKNVIISDEEIKNYYENNEKYFNKEKVRASQILISNIGEDGNVLGKQKKQELKEKAKDILNKIKSGENFEKLATKYSDDRISGSRGGDLGYFLREDKNSVFSDVAFSLNKNEVSSVFETVYGYHIVKVLDKQSTLKSLEESKDDIKLDLIKEKFIQHTKSLYKDFTISIK